MRENRLHTTPAAYGLTGRADRRRGIRLLTLLAVVIAGGAAPGLGAVAHAFHDGGTASCEACHVMHDAVAGQILMSGADPLLTAATASDVCLVCHAGSGGSLGGVLAGNPSQPGPERGAGNFTFLLEDNINDSPGGFSNPLGGHAAGHSIVSLAYNLTADPRRSHGPGGNYPSSQLGCTSCHDPHGNANFRMLNGVGEVQGGAANFTYPAPIATGLDIMNPQQTEARDRHTAYVSGMSAWCANCHGQYHDSGGSNFEHDFGASLDHKHYDQYNRYEGSASPGTGLAATAYLPEVPFEDPGATINRTSGPGGGSTVMCLTCHRAHASSAPAAGRWDFRLTDLNQDGLVSGSYPLPNPYPGMGVQGSLCAKCHEDEGETPHFRSE